VALIGLSLVAVVPALDHWLPTGLARPAMALASGAGTVGGGELATAVAGTLVLLAACAAGSVAAFRRREL
jgi:hypothetical protein